MQCLPETKLQDSLNALATAREALKVSRENGLWLQVPGGGQPLIKWLRLKGESTVIFGRWVKH